MGAVGTAAAADRQLRASGPRRLRIEQLVQVENLPPDAYVLDIWHPLVSDDPYQQVLDLSIDVDHPVELGHDPEHGNRIMHLRLHRPLPAVLGFRLSALVLRASRPQLGRSGRAAASDLLLRPHLEVPLQADALRRSQRLVEQLAGRETDQLSRALRLREAPGVGDGCEGLEAVERYIELCRVAGVPARLVGGLRLGPSSDGGAGGPHAWAELFIGDRGWVPVDVRCGGHAGAAGDGLLMDHVAISRGQGLLLHPVQRGPRVRALTGAYAEVDGAGHAVRSTLRASTEPVAEPAPRRAGPGLPVADLGTMLAEELALLRPPPPQLKVPQGAMLPPGGGGEWIYVLTRGRVRLSRLTVGGRRLDLEQLEAPDFFQAEPIRQGVAEAVEESELRPMTREQALQVARARPDLGFRLLEAFGSRLVEREERLEYLAYHSVPARLAGALLRLRDQRGVVEDVTHQQLGDIVGAYRETVTKVLRHLQQDGLIEVRHRRLRVLDAAGLAGQLER
ncbi:MAG: helix-turn-helix domain-containing protein [Candidatus Dormibacteraeota bacterium]|nr:helix-turn-helix domain-containing protein [Candidatus Dormibacteraeota bacterium]